MQEVLYGRRVAGVKLKVGAKLPGDRWTVGEPFADGRRFQLYLGADGHLDGKRVALKVPRGEVWASAEEARAAMTLEGEFLTSPSALIPEPLEILEVDGWPVLVMEYISGETLRAQIDAGRWVGVVRAVAIVRELALFASEMRTRGFVFRAFSPDHVLFGLDDVVHIVGTGNAVRTSSGVDGADVASLRALLERLVPDAPPALKTILCRDSPDDDAAALARALGSLRIEVEPAQVRDEKIHRRGAEDREGKAVVESAVKTRKSSARRVWPWGIAAVFGIAGAAAAVYFFAFHGR